MQTVTLKVGSASTGRDYATIAAAWAAIPADLVAADASYVIELYNDSEFIMSAGVNLSGKNTDSTHTITIRPADGQGYANNSNVTTNALRYNPANGVAFKSTLNGAVALQISNQWTILDGVQIDAYGTGTCCGLVLNADNAIMQNCLVEYSGTTSSTDVTSLTSFATSVHAGTFRNNVVVLKAANSYGVRFYNGAAALVENVTVVRLPSLARGQYGFYAPYASYMAGKTMRNCAVFGADFSLFKSNGTYDHVASDGALGFTGAGNLENLLASNQFVDPTSDLRLKAGADLIDAGTTPGATNTNTISGNRQMGTSCDIGAWEYPQAIAAPLAKVTSITVNGNDVTISGTYTGSVTGGQASVTPIAITGNNAVAQGPTALTLSPGAFTVDFPNCKVGKYGLTVTVSNSAYTVQATNDLGGFEILGGQILTTVQDPVAGQTVTIHGTCSNATSGNLIIPALASNPNGAIDQSVTLTINTAVTPNTYTASATLAPGNYAAGSMTLTNADGTSLPFTNGMSAVTIYAISGNPDAPAQAAPDTVPPTMPGTMSISNVTSTSMLAQWTAGQDDVGVVAYEFSQDNGTTWANIGNVLSKQLNSLTPSTLYQLAVRALDPGNNHSNALTAQDTTLADSGGGGTPTPGARTISFTLFTPTDTPAVNLSSLRWAWFDQATPDLFTAPTDKGTLEVTDASGVLSIPLPGSQLAVGGTGWLIVTNSSGDPAAAHAAFSGPVVVG